MSLMEFGNPRGLVDAEAVSFVKQGVGKGECIQREDDCFVASQVTNWDQACEVL